MTRIPLRHPVAASIATDAKASGYRSTDTVKVYGITVGMRATWPSLDTAGAEANDFYERNTLHVAVVKWRSPMNIVSAAANLPGPIDQDQIVSIDGQQAGDHRTLLLFDRTPKPAHLLPITPWGYSSRLDNPSTVIPAPGGAPAEPLPENEFQKLGPYQNKKTVWRTKMTNRFKNKSVTQANIQRFTKYIKLKKPMVLKYSLTQTNGSRLQSPDKLFLCLRTEIPDADAGNFDAAPYVPDVQGFYKLHYYDS